MHLVCHIRKKKPQVHAEVVVTCSPRDRQIQNTLTPTHSINASNWPATRSTSSHDPAHGVSQEGDLLQVFTQVISADENIHCHKEGSTGKRQTAYPSELLDSTKYPHHSINLLLQPPGPVLHTARDRETERKRKGEKKERKSQSPDT